MNNVTHSPKHRSFVPLIAMVVVGSIFGASSALACPIPVFQYSLEYWEADPYDIIVHHNGSFTSEEQAAVDALQEAEGGEEGHSNITVMLRDHSQIDNPSVSGDDLPRMEARYPVISGIRRSVWTGELTVENVENLLHSPLRQEIAEHLLDRDTAVWVLLESGNRRADRRALRMLETELNRLEDTLTVPDPQEEFGIDLGDIYTDIEFTIVQLDREDPDEQMFINMLLEVERDLREFEDQPMAFPIYGRGLIMYALIGEGINEGTLNAAGEFLTGPCSCQVKSGNPGVDILMTVNWEDKVEQLTDAGVAGPDGGDFLDQVETQND